MATRLIGHTLRVTDAREVAVSLDRDDTALRLRVVSTGDVPVAVPALRDRLRGRRSGLVRAASVVRQRGGTLEVERSGSGSAVEVRLPTGDGGLARRRPTARGASRPG